LVGGKILVKLCLLKPVLAVCPGNLKKAPHRKEYKRAGEFLLLHYNHEGPHCVHTKGQRLCSLCLLNIEIEISVERTFFSRLKFIGARQKSKSNNRYVGDRLNFANQRTLS